MSLPIKLPVTASPNLTANIFTATWNVPTANRYDFTNVAANQNQTVIQTTGSSVYVIERNSFSMTVDEGVFQSSIDSTVSVPRFKFISLKSGQQIYHRPLPFINFVDNMELLLFYPSDQTEDEIQVTFECVLNQVPATVGIATIKAFLQLNIYEVQNTDWLRRFYHSVQRPEGDLRIRGARPGEFCSIKEGTFG